MGNSVVSEIRAAGRTDLVERDKVSLRFSAIAAAFKLQGSQRAVGAAHSSFTGNGTGNSLQQHFSSISRRPILT
jgi:hypothetical protein